MSLCECCGCETPMVGLCQTCHDCWCDTHPDGSGPNHPESDAD